MASKMYFVRYLESRQDLCVASSPTFIMRTSFHAGLLLGRNNGHRTKRAALAWVEKVNQAAKKTIAEYAGAYYPSAWPE